MFFFDTYNAVAAREDRIPKYWRLGRRHLGLSLTLWRHNVKRNILNMVCDCWFPCSCVYWSLVKARKIRESLKQSIQVALHSRKHFKLNPRWRRPSRQYFGFRSSRAATALHVSEKTLLFALIKVSNFICKREISGLSSPLKKFSRDKLGVLIIDCASWIFK